MMEVQNFIVNLLRGSTSVKEAKNLWAIVLGTKETIAIYKILKIIKEGKHW
jgi:hypothetical protein